MKDKACSLEIGSANVIKLVALMGYLGGGYL